MSQQFQTFKITYETELKLTDLMLTISQIHKQRHLLIYLQNSIKTWKNNIFHACFCSAGFTSGEAPSNVIISGLNFIFKKLRNKQNFFVYVFAILT